MSTVIIEGKEYHRAELSDGRILLWPVYVPTPEERKKSAEYNRQALDKALPQLWAQMAGFQVCKCPFCPNGAMTARKNGWVYYYQCYECESTLSGTAAMKWVQDKEAEREQALG